MAKKSTNLEIETDGSPSYWYNWITAAKQAAKPHWEVSANAWNEYLLAENKAKGASDTVVQPPARFPLFWSSIKNLQPAYYARTPETVARRMFDGEDHTARVGCLILERLSKYLMSHYPINDGMIHATLDFLIADKATARIYLEEIKEQFEQVIPVAQTGLGEYIDMQTGEVMPPDAAIELAEDGISLVARVTVEQVVKVCTEVVPVPFSDIIHTPNAQSWCDIKTIGFKMWMSKPEFAKKFGESFLSKVSFGSKEQTGDETNKVTKNEGNNQSLAEVSSGIEIWEIWDKPTKKVMYMAAGYSSEFIQVLDDPYKLRDFFPCAPFIIGTKPPKSMYPTPMFKQLEPMIDQMHRLFTRITRMTSSLRRRGIADKSMTDVIEAINQLGDFEVIGSSHFQQLVESKAKGVDPIWYLPLTELSNALTEAQGLLASYKQLFFEISGVPDVVRGVTDYRETASAQQQKGEFYNVRSSWDQHLIQELARKIIEMQCELALARMPDDLIIEVCHLQSIEAEDVPLVPQALALLKNDKQLSIRIDIETDSLTFVQNNKKQEERNLVVTTVMQGLTQVAQIGTTNPQFLRPAMQMLMMSLRGVDLGKAYEQSIEQAVKALEEAANQPPPPPPPDYEGMKLQIQQQALVQKSQIEASKMQLQQLEAQIKQAELQVKQFVAQSDVTRQDRELMLKAQEVEQGAMKLQTDASLKVQELQIDAGAIQSKIDIDQMNAQLKAMESGIYQQIEQQKMQMTEIQHAMTMQEKMMEEKRLARDSEIQIAKTMLEQEKMQVELQKMIIEAASTAEKVQQERVTRQTELVEPAPKPKKRAYKIQKTDDGFIGESKDVEDNGE